MGCIGNNRIIDAATTTRSLELTKQFLADLLVSEGLHLGELEGWERNYALSASVGQVLVGAWLEAVTAEPETLQTGLMGVATGLVIALYQQVGEAAPTVVGRMFAQGMADGMNRVRDLYDAKGSA